MERGQPTVTVVIPVYNGVNYLAEAIESVLAQSYEDFEVLVVDDGSTDDTWGMIERYRAEHPDVVRGLHKANGGTATALNAGIREARGKYVAWLSHDDRFMPHKLETQLRVLQAQPDVVGVYSDFAYINHVGQRTGYVHSIAYPQAHMIRHLLQCTFINGSTLLVERRCFVEVGLFDETLRYTHDLMMWLHLAHRYRLAYIPEALTEYRRHAVQVTFTQPILPELWRLFDKAMEQFTLEDIFPELTEPHVTAVDRAAAYIYLGDVFAMALHLHLSLVQYAKAWWAWPHIRNPVLSKAPRIAKRLVKRMLASSNKRLDHMTPFQPPDKWIEMDLASISRRVKDFRL